MTSPALPPAPLPDADTAPFWDAAGAHRLVIPRCRACARWIWQPRPLCPRCHAPDPEWVGIDGDATVVSWTVVHPPVLPVWSGRTPFVILLVELTGAPGVRMIGQLTDSAGGLLQTDGVAEGIAIGARLALGWRVDEAGTTLPVWTLLP